LKKILIIEDDHHIGNILKKALSATDYYVEWVQDSESGIIRQDKVLFDLAIIDMLLPHKQGLETIIELKDKYPGLKVLAISGGGNFNSETSKLIYLRGAKAGGADDILPKPFTINEMMQKITQLLQ